jgi:hypothetical protein
MFDDLESEAITDTVEVIGVMTYGLRGVDPCNFLLSGGWLHRVSQSVGEREWNTSNSLGSLLPCGDGLSGGIHFCQPVKQFVCKGGYATWASSSACESIPKTGA